MTTALRFRAPDLAALTSVTDRLAATAAEYDRTSAFPAEGISAAHEAGLLTATVAERYGGPGSESPLRPASCTHWARAIPRWR
ncbi:acyl-CoA dehydrogenase family protein [Streptomyces ipomoeae]|uniref:Acyl-CoA dehydrogenase/oxidase N-terminal domain-containing protein n=1 Tax=Streptomyces ipomoeae 91-03 TaxID=698759 RepID=L1KKL9_9ACTN|nr:acyl-CoA dehydrogenase family protein [Streptomyces ipomoeae]EKX60923.1 hypothetical protein STRIP9103_00042 [Streptomyces ipomoeae 91-03]